VLLLLRLAAGLFEPVLLKLPPLLAHGLLVLEVFNLSHPNLGKHESVKHMLVQKLEYMCFTKNSQ
jgi:hypothetical protein